MKTLTIDPLWAWAILAGHKPIENRSWKTNHRGPLAIHAGQNKSREGEILRALDAAEIDAPTEELRGRILGTVDLVEIIPYEPTAASPHLPRSLGQLPWATGPFCWILRAPVWLEDFVPASGVIGLWEWNPAEAVASEVSR